MQNLLIHNVYGHIHVVNGRRGGGGGEWQEGVSREEGTMYCTYAFMDHMTIRGRWSVVGGGVVLERKEDGQGEELAM